MSAAFNIRDQEKTAERDPNLLNGKVVTDYPQLTSKGTPDRRVTTRSQSKATSKPNPWNEFQKAVKGEGLTPEEIADLYRHYKDQPSRYGPSVK